MSRPDRQLYQELGELTRYIERTVRKMHELVPPIQASAGQLPQASQQLAELVTISEQGTHTVMQLAEEIIDNHAALSTELEHVASALRGAGPDAPELERITGMQQILTADDQRLMNIITQLSFQDLISQRVKTVLATLEDIERRLVEMVVVFGVGHDGHQAPDDRKAEALQKQLDASKSSALNQDTVDEILAEFGFN